MYVMGNTCFVIYYQKIYSKKILIYILLHNHSFLTSIITLYHIAGKFGKSSVICQTKTIQISAYSYNLLAESIHLPNAQNE